MQLSRTERLILANQYKTLERLDSNEAAYYRRCREAIENGYAREYGTIAQHVYPDEHCLTEDECREVFDILLMFSDLQEAQQALDPDERLEDWYVEFAGFDGNNESTRLGYCHYLMADERASRFHRLHRGDDYNSHMPVLDGYQRMLAVWRRIKSARHGQLSKDDMIAIVSERPHATSEIGKAMREPGPRH